MVTHLISGCLGLTAVWLLFKYEREGYDTYLYVSVMMLLLSTLAKEDFILFYGFSFAYVLVKSKKPFQKQIIIGFIGLAVSLMMVAGAKVLGSSIYLGTTGSQSPYFIDLSPTSVATTVWKYLKGSGHPAMEGHGQTIATVMIVSNIMVLVAILRDRSIPKTFYFTGAALALIAPYSVLPNHVNAYYELIWLPFIIGSAYVAVVELMNTSELSPPRAYLASALFAALCLLLNVVDAPGRTSVAQWYDAIGLDNAKLLKRLKSDKAALNSAQSVCVYGANAFSPWYMHSGQYLQTVMGLHTLWKINIDKSSPLYSGFQQGAASSKGSVILLDSADANVNCLRLLIQKEITE